MRPNLTMCGGRMYPSLAACLLAISASLATNCTARGESGYYTDPSTGIVYRKVIRTVERPVVETRMTQQQQTVYKPKTVTETRPTTRQTFTPVTHYQWVPQVEGWWNPFRQPRVAYRHVPQTVWQARSEVVAETKTHVQWEPEVTTVQIPEQSMKIAREEQVDFEPVGRVAVASAASTGSPSVSPQIASRLRPLSANQSLEPYNAATVGGTRLAGSEPPRSNLQTGLRATELMPRNAPTFGPIGGNMDASGVAGLPTMRLWR